MIKTGEKGSITVFLSMVMVVLLSVILLFQEAMRIYLGYGRIAIAMDGAGQHVLADYNQALAEQYDLYALDETYNGYGTEELLTRVQDYLEYQYEPNPLPGVSSGFQRITVNTVSIEEQQYLTAEHTQELMKQISEYVKLYAVSDGMETLISQMTGAQDSRNQAEELGKQVKEKVREEEEARQQAMKETSTESSKEENQPTAPPVKDPRDGLTSLLSKGVLYYITDGDPSLGSECTLETAEPQTFLDGDRLAGFLKKNTETEWKGTVEEKAKLSYYLHKHFRSYCCNPNEYQKENRCELEYLIGGKDSDADNLNYVAGKIIALRFPMNYAVAVGDSRMRQEALAVATALVGATGIAPAITVVQYLLLGAWAYGETLVEMKGLLQQKSVALVKTSDQWNVSLSNLGAGGISCNHVDGGISYEQYVTLLLAMTDMTDIVTRMYQVIEHNLQIENPEFEMEHCMWGFALTGMHKILPNRQLLSFIPEEWYQYDRSVTVNY